MMQNLSSNRSTVCEKSALLAALFAIFGEACCSHFFGHGFRYLVILTVLFSMLPAFLKWLNGRFDDKLLRAFPLAVAAPVLCLFSLPFWTSSFNIYTYIGIPVAFALFSLDRKLLNAALISLLVINLGLGLYEFMSRSYLFANEVVKNGEITVLDVNSVGKLYGLYEVIRVKGLFYGCLSLGLFALGVAVFFSRNTLIMLLCLLTAVISGTRLAIIMILLLIVINPAIRLKYRIFSLIAVAVLVAAGAALLGSYDSATLERIIRVFDLEEGSHDNRILMWQYGLEQFLSYDFLHLFTGNNGLFFQTYTNNTESGWLTLLTDTGIAGFLLYFIPLVCLTGHFLAKKKYHPAAVTVIFFASNVTVTFNLSMTGNLMYWFCMFKFYELLTQPEDYAAGIPETKEEECDVVRRTGTIRQEA